jgi:hypothetical protein
MENQSFRDILAGFLEEKEAIAPLKKPSATPETPSFHWENLELNAFKPKAAYPKPERKTVPLPKAKPAVQEPKWAVSELNPNDQRQIKKLVQMGATEINGEISLSILKKAHRRLAKKLHPDTGNEKSQEGFLALQSIYECLSERLSDLVAGSESASAPASRRPSAA